jgi:glycerol-3-phosphate acyltransferase PlsX
VGLLNVGSEEQKGHDELRQAAAILREGRHPLRFHGFIEGDDIAKGTVDVVVADGFSGNVAIKSAEGTARLVTEFLRHTFKSSILAMIGYIFSRHALRKLRARLDPRRYNGAVFLGVNGIVVKSHGGSDALGFATAIGVAIDMVQYGFIASMKRDFEKAAGTAAGGTAAGGTAAGGTPLVPEAPQEPKQAAAG